jgi:hypothetical protein
MRRVLSIAGLTVLAACSGLPQVSRGVGMAFLGRAPEKIPVADQSVIVAGPPGYCIDRDAIRDEGGAAFVLLGSCASITGRAGKAAPAIPAVLTASISERNGADVSAAMAQMARYFESKAGRAALARDGRAASVEVLDSRQENGVFLLKASDQSPNPATGLAPDYWRALFDLNGRLMTLSILEFEDKPMADRVAVSTLLAFVERVRRENPALAPEPEHAAEAL